MKQKRFKFFGQYGTNNELEFRKQIQDGVTMIGQFDKNGGMQGFGRVIYEQASDRKEYKGQSENGQMSGFGSLAYKNGELREGIWKNDLQNGYGRLKILSKESNNTNEFDEYIGEFIAGKMQGKGIYAWANGDKYEGDYINNKRCGKGKFTWANNQKFYEGDWEDDIICGQSVQSDNGQMQVQGLFHGQSRHINQNEDSYEGQFCNGFKERKGTLFFANGNKYEGDNNAKIQKDNNSIKPQNNKLAKTRKSVIWFVISLLAFVVYYIIFHNDKHCRYDQYYTTTWADGSWYEGGWKNGNKCGFGKYTWADGSWYEGEWENDNQCGFGKYTMADGSWYEGEWKNGKRNGKGKQVFANGNSYEGNFVNGKFHGHGKYTWANGGWYEGEWKNGFQDGKGKSVRYF